MRQRQALPAFPMTHQPEAVSRTMPDLPHSSIQSEALPTLREGFTTGSCATAALIAAMELMFTGQVSQSISIPLPPFPRLSGSVNADKIKWLSLSPLLAASGMAFPEEAELVQERNIFPCTLRYISHAAVIKDGGDDPDITHGLPIYVTLFASQGAKPFCPLPFTADFLKFIAGRGVGKVTRPGLALPPGEAAINPVPRAQMLFAASFYFQKFTTRATPAIQPPFAIIISAPGGELVARQTLNPKLGIDGGISILGTRGIVRPFSHKAWEETIKREISVARACGLDTICFSTGRRSEEFLKFLYPQLPPLAFVQAGDVAAISLAFAAGRGFGHIHWGCFFGKLCKLVQGLANTHAHSESLDLNLLANLCFAQNSLRGEAVRHCNTAREALEIILQDCKAQKILEKLLIIAKKNLEKYAGQPVTLHLFHEEKGELARL